MDLEERSDRRGVVPVLVDPGEVNIHVEEEVTHLNGAVERSQWWSERGEVRDG